MDRLSSVPSTVRTTHTEDKVALCTISLKGIITYLSQNTWEIQYFHCICALKGGHKNDSDGKLMFVWWDICTSSFPVERPLNMKGFPSDLDMKNLKSTWQPSFTPHATPLLQMSTPLQHPGLQPRGQTDQMTTASSVLPLTP